jgi:hypothetical protein
MEKSIMTLEQLLEVHIANVRRVIAESVGPGGDIGPMCAAFCGGHVAEVATVQISADMRTRQGQHDQLAQWLKSLGAEAYAWVAPAWSVTVQLANDNLGVQQADIIAGGGVKAHPDREEVVLCVVGDKSATLSTELLVVRSEDGRITELQPTRVSRTVTGLFHDLMLQAPGPVS